MNEEKIRFRLQLRHAIEGNAIEADILVEIPWKDSSDVQFEGPVYDRVESETIATRVFVHDGDAWSDSADKAKVAARQWAARGLAKAFGAFFAADPQTKGS